MALHQGQASAGPIGQGWAEFEAQGACMGQHGRYDVLIFLGVEGAGGVDQASQPWQGQGMAQQARLKGSQPASSMQHIGKAGVNLGGTCSGCAVHTSAMHQACTASWQLVPCI